MTTKQASIAKKKQDTQKVNLGESPTLSLTVVCGAKRRLHQFRYTGERDFGCCRAFLSLLAFSGLFCDDQLTSKASLLARVGILFFTKRFETQQLQKRWKTGQCGVRPQRGNTSNPTRKKTFKCVLLHPVATILYCCGFLVPKHLLLQNSSACYNFFVFFRCLKVAL